MDNDKYRDIPDNLVNEIFSEGVTHGESVQLELDEKKIKAAYKDGYKAALEAAKPFIMALMSVNEVEEDE